MDATADFLALPLAETDNVRIAASLSTSRGLEVALRATPVPGSGFERRVKAKTPYPVTAGLTAPNTNAVFATGAWPTLAALAQSVLDQQAAAQVPGAAAIAARLRPLTQTWSGAIFARTLPQADSLALDLGFGLRPGTPPSAPIDALGALLADPALPTLLQEVWGKHVPQIATKRSASGLDVTFAFVSGTPPAAVAYLLTGTTTLTLAMQVRDGTLFIGSEPGGRPRQEKLAGAAAQPGGTLAAALADANGREGVLFVELWGLARPVLHAALSPSQRRFVDMLLSMPGLSNMSLPLSLTFDGGDAFHADLRAPTQTLHNLSALLNLLGGGIGPSAGP